MKAIMKYTLHDYLRSYVFVPPVVIFIIWTIISYTYVPNPVLSSYAVSCVALYFTTAWLSLTLMDKEESVQQQITIIHAKSFYKVLSGKILSILFMSGILSVFAFLYPVLIGAFGHMPTFLEGFVSLISLMLISLLSISITIYFSRTFRQRTISSWLMLALLLVISLVRVGMEEVLPSFLSFLTWLLPPSFTILDSLDEETVIFDGSLLLKWLHVIIYSLILFAVFYRVKSSKGVY